MLAVFAINSGDRIEGIMYKEIIVVQCSTLISNYNTFYHILVFWGVYHTPTLFLIMFYEDEDVYSQ